MIVTTANLMTSTRLIRLVPNHRRLSIGACKLPQILFLGSDSFSCAVLKELIARRELWNEIHVVTPPITRKGRGLKNVYRAPLLDLAERLNLKSEALSREANGDKNPLRQWALPQSMANHSDSSHRVLITASFPYFVPKELINQFPPSHCLNLHPSNLPLYRGPAPIQWQLADRVDRLGVTIQDLSPHGFDLGDVLAQQAVPLPPNTSYVIAESLLALIGAKLMCKVLKNLPEVIETAQKQDPQMATKARKISQSDLTVRQDWNLATLKTRYLGMGHQHHLNIQIDGRLYFIIPDFNTYMSQAVHEALLASEPGTIMFDKRNDLIGIRLWDRGADLLTIKSIKLAAAGGKGWVGPQAWWDSISQRRRRTSGGDINDKDVIKLEIDTP